MKREELALLLQEGETHKIELKESINGIDREIVAFANASGGKILIGVKDDGTIRGVKITNRLKAQIQDIAKNCDPGFYIPVFNNIDDINKITSEIKDLPNIEYIIVDVRNVETIKNKVSSNSTP